jgi:hypothetical protein
MDGCAGAVTTISTICGGSRSTQARIGGLLKSTHSSQARVRPGKRLIMVIPFAHLAVMQMKAAIGEAVQIAGVIAACSADARNTSQRPTAIVQSIPVSDGLCAKDAAANERLSNSLRAVTTGVTLAVRVHVLNTDARSVGLTLFSFSSSERLSSRIAFWRDAPARRCSGRVEQFQACASAAPAASLNVAFRQRAVRLPAWIR